MAKKTKELDDKLDKVSETAKKIEAFSELLNSLEEVDSKKKLLW